MRAYGYTYVQLIKLYRDIALALIKVSEMFKFHLLFRRLYIYKYIPIDFILINIKYRRVVLTHE